MARIERSGSSFTEPTIGSIIGGSMESDLQRIKANKNGLHAYVKDHHKGEFTTYTIRIEYFEVRNEFLEPISWQIETRYSEFDQFLKTLKERCPEVELPALPRRRLTSSMTTAAIEERTKGIDTILTALLPKYAGEPFVRTFFKLAEGEKVADELLEVQRTETLPFITLTVHMAGDEEDYTIRVKAYEEVAASLHRECIQNRHPEPSTVRLARVCVGDEELRRFNHSWEGLHVADGDTIRVVVESLRDTFHFAGGDGDDETSISSFEDHATQAGLVLAHMRYTRQQGGGLDPLRYQKDHPGSLFPACVAGGMFHPGLCHGITGTGYRDAWWTCCMSEQLECSSPSGVNTVGCCVQEGYKGPLGEAAHGLHGGSGAAPARTRVTH